MHRACRGEQFGANLGRRLVTLFTDSKIIAMMNWPSAIVSLDLEDDLHQCISRSCPQIILYLKLEVSVCGFLYLVWLNHLIVYSLHSHIEESMYSLGCSMSVEQKASSYHELHHSLAICPIDLVSVRHTNVSLAPF